jgi:hypothetical protein
MKAISLAAAMRDPKLLGGPFQAPSFWPWHCLARIISGEPLDTREAELFRKCTGRTKLPTGPVNNLTLLVGRRGGKDRFLSAVAVHRAALSQNWGSLMSAGEQGVVILIGSDRRQAKILRRYCGALVAMPLIKAEVARHTDDILEFRNMAALEVCTNDAGTVRGRSVLALLGTETAFWNTDPDASSSDEEVVAAAEPGAAMVPDGGLTILSSSVHRKKGLMYRRWKELHGADDAEDIVWLASSRTMNPALPQKVVDKAKLKDPQRAAAEFESIWREDISDFVPRDIVEQAIDRGVKEREPIPGIEYAAFTDPAGGSGKDSFSLCIGHRGPDNMVVQDVLRERQPRFVPKAVVKEYSDLLKQYRISKIKSDRYANAWASDEWARNGITCEPSALSKSEIYLAALPVLMSGQARLLDSERLRDQLTGLERRVYASGRETVDDSGAQSAHDDLANVACGVLVNLSFKKYEAPTAYFGVYGGSYGFNGLYTTHDPNESWGARFASRPPEFWARQGIFHERDREYWIRKGVYVPPSESKPMTEKLK